jgi:hypothetical protein
MKFTNPFLVQIILLKKVSDWRYNSEEIPDETLPVVI